ncbi:MAG: Na/Pi cotransporter family protein [Clostridia bacterium]|nr:Na/Pi cotransporter family protein [Clostridia bacterium]
MTIFDVLTLIGGLSLFLFGMNLMGQALERRAGNKLRTVLGRLTTKKSVGFLTGLLVTAVIQSSSATTVMVVGFVNSGLLALGQAINVIIGANVGTTVTAWLLSLSGIDGGNVFVQLLKPTSFTPVLAVIGIVLYMFCRGDKKKDVGVILLGFATLMFGMDTMSSAVAGLKDVEGFRNLFLLFTNPLLGVLAGAILTAIIQSSSASVGILQALAVTGQVSYGAAIPIIMGQNIGTCVTAVLSAVGANKNAKRAAMVHLSFNVIGTVVWLVVFWLIKWLVKPIFLTQSASLFGIAVAHSVFNVLCTLLLLPLTGFLEKIVCRLVPDAKMPETAAELDERFFATPAVALERSRRLATEMAVGAIGAMRDALACLDAYSPELAQKVREQEEKSDHYEDILGTYLVQFSTMPISASDSAEAALLLKVIGDFERISDHGVNIVESAEEMRDKGINFTDAAKRELAILAAAVNEIMDLTLRAFVEGDAQAVAAVEPLEQVIDNLKETLRSNHIQRLQQGDSTMDIGFVWGDLLTNLERTADHCSNVAGGLLDLASHNMNMHENLRAMKRDNNGYATAYAMYKDKYALA